MNRKNNINKKVNKVSTISFDGFKKRFFIKIIKVFSSIETMFHRVKNSKAVQFTSELILYLTAIAMLVLIFVFLPYLITHKEFDNWFIIFY